MNEAAANVIQFTGREAATGLEKQQKDLATQGKRLRVLREKRDRLRLELAETMKEIGKTADAIGKLTVEMVDEGKEEANGKRK